MSRKPDFLDAIELAIQMEMQRQIAAFLEDAKEPDVSAVGEEHLIGYRAGYKAALGKIEQKLQQMKEESTQ